MPILRILASTTESLFPFLFAEILDVLILPGERVQAHVGERVDGNYLHRVCDENSASVRLALRGAEHQRYGSLSLFRWFLRQLQLLHERQTQGRNDDFFLKSGLQLRTSSCATLGYIDKQTRNIKQEFDSDFQVGRERPSRVNCGRVVWTTTNGRPVPERVSS